jgi:predicted O-methyltransferase YrrM
MEDLSLLVDLHLDGDRQGPGSSGETRRALDLALEALGVESEAALHVADIGCGIGASTLALAEQLPNARITAIDLFPEFLERLVRNAEAAGCSDRIAVLQVDMAKLPMEAGSLDLVWSEGAIYNMGFREGIAAWRSFLKPGGVLAVSEITWIMEERPQELEAYWQAEYPQMATAGVKLEQLAAAGYSPVGHFFLPESCWTEAYYAPLAKRLDAFLDRHGNSAAAKAIAGAEQKEQALYERHKDCYSYGFYIARKD